MAGFFALAAETPTLRVAWARQSGSRRPRAPCAHRLGERARRPEARARAVAPRLRPGRLLTAGAGSRNQSLAVHAQGWCTSTGGSTRLPRIRWGKATGRTCSARHCYPGALSRPFGPSCARSTFAARRMTIDPVQAGGLFRRWAPYPREALRLSSGAAPGCLELRFYNRRLTSRAPVETSPPETGRERRGKPVGVHFPDHPRAGNSPSPRRRRTTRGSSGLRQPRA